MSEESSLIAANEETLLFVAVYQTKQSDMKDAPIVIASDFRERGNPAHKVEISSEHCSSQ